VNLKGLDASLSYTWNKAWSANLKSMMIRSWNLSDNDYLIFQPADRWSMNLRYEKKWMAGYSSSLEMGPTFVAKQNRVPENTDFTEPPPSYWLWNVQGTFRKTTGRFRFDASLEIQNANNQTYRDYMNRFRYYAYDLGRNLVFRFSIPF